MMDATVANLTWSATTSGSHNICIRLNPDKTIQEMDYTNNEASKSIFVYEKPEVNPPTITNVKPGNIVVLGGSFIEFNCSVTDDTGVKSVWLNYTTDNWATYNINKMNNPYGDFYNTSLILSSDTEYKVESSDVYRNIGSSGIYAVTIVKGIVLFDESHDETFFIDPNAKYSYSKFASLLEDKGYEVKTLNSSPITTEKLNNCSIFVIPAPTKPFDTNEIMAIREFVSNGGNLLLINEWGGDFRQGSNLNDLSKSFGVVFNLTMSHLINFI